MMKKKWINSPLHREQMEIDINAVNGFTFDEMHEWSDQRLVKYYRESIKNSIFSPKKEYRRDQMKNLLARATV